MLGGSAASQVRIGKALLEAANCKRGEVSPLYEALDAADRQIGEGVMGQYVLACTLFQMDKASMVAGATECLTELIAEGEAALNGEAND